MMMASLIDEATSITNAADNMNALAANNIFFFIFSSPSEFKFI